LGIFAHRLQSKARLWIREGKESSTDEEKGNNRVIWFHASIKFEQGRPVMEEIRINTCLYHTAYIFLPS
jgi:hypothetical protein